MAAGKREPTTRPKATGAFVGREREMQAIDAAFDEARDGRPRFVLLLGEPGIGKTRLAMEASDLFRKAGASVLWGRCHEEPGTPPYWPWIQALRTYVSETPDQDMLADLGAGLLDIANLVPVLRERFPEAASAPSLSDPEFARFRLFDSVVGFIRNVSTRRPVVLVFDNLHWADRPSLLLLAFLAENLGTARVLVIGTYRPDVLTRVHPLSSTLADLTREASPLRIRLGGLGKDETLRLLESAAGSPAPRELADAVQAHTEGNPLFIGEVGRWLRERRDIWNAAGSGGYLNLGIPDGVREVIGKRLGRLDPRCVEILGIASVIGREFDLDLLARLPSCSPYQGLAQHIEEGLAARVIEEVLAGRYQFSHALIRETLYEELSLLRREDIHREVGRAIQETRGSDPSALSHLAHHLARAARAGERPAVEQAIKYCVLAAQHALDLLGYEEGVRTLEEALELLRLVPDDQERVQLLSLLGRARHLAGSASGAMEAFEEAVGLARRLGDAGNLAAAAIGFEDASFRPGLYGGKAVQLLEDALAFFVEGSDPGVRSRLLAALGRALVYTGQTDRAMRVTDEAVRLARQCGDKLGIGAAHWVLLSLVWQPERLPDRVAAARELIDIGVEVGDLVLQRDGIGSLACALLELGDADGFDEQMFQKHAFVRAQLRQPFHSFAHVSVEAAIAIWQGRFADAERLADESLRIAPRLRGYDVFGAYSVQMFTLRREQGSLAQLQPVIEKFTATTPQQAVWRPGLALIYAELGKRSEARAHFDALMKDGLGSINRDALWPVLLAYLAEVCHFLDDQPRAAELHEALVPFGPYNIAVGGLSACLGPAARFLGLLDETIGRPEEAESHFRDAIAMSERMRAPVWLAHTQFECGRMLLAGDPKREEEARVLLRAAREITERVGMRGLQPRIDELIGPATVPNERPAPTAEPLSDREVEVLRLIAQGKSNREIAEALVISINTAANHVKNILGKTGAANRTEAASYAFRSGRVARPR